MVRAVQLEERYSKDEILSIYLTLAPFGGNLEGVRAASLSYFGKEPSSLDLSEARCWWRCRNRRNASAPTVMPSRAKAGRDKVLARMVAEGVVTASRRERGDARGRAFVRQAMPLSAPHLAARLAQQNKIHAHRHHHRCFAASRRRAAGGAGDALISTTAPSLAIVVVENKTRNVLAYVGGTNYWGASGQIDLAARARSPGSALKPFIYGLAFDDLILHPSTMMEDEATTFGDYAPRDFDGAFQGAVTARDALRMSLNVPAVMVLDRVGPVALHARAHNAGAHLAFPTHDEAPSLPMALGGLGISLADITMLYAGIAEGGDGAAVALSQRSTARRCASPVRPGRGLLSARYSGRCVAARRLGDGTGAVLVAQNRASRPARPTAIAMPGRWASRTITPSASGWAAPTARRAWAMWA